MDFRAVDPAALTWDAWYRGQPGARAAGTGAKVTVQTPVAPCRVSLAGSGMYRIDMRLRPDVAAHAAFAEWVGELENAASEAPELAEWRQDKARSTSVYNGNFRLMAFSDTLTFDAAGKLSFQLIDAASCACLVELQGCWSTPAKWGLRWKVVQVKFDSSPMDLPPAPPPAEPTPPAPAAFAFVDD